MDRVEKCFNHSTRLACAPHQPNSSLALWSQSSLEVALSRKHTNAVTEPPKQPTEQQKRLARFKAQLSTLVYLYRKQEPQLPMAELAA